LKLQFQRLFADKSLKRGDPCLVSLDKIRGTSVFVESAIFVQLDQDPDPLA